MADPARRNINVGSEFPGTWTDAEGGIHFDVPEIHRILGLPDSQADREETLAMMTKLLREKLPAGTKIIPRFSSQD